MSIFPSGAPPMEPKKALKNNIDSVGRSFVFNYETGQFLIQDGQIKETSELDAIEQWIELCLRTYKDKFKVYLGTNFGCNTEDIIGKKLTPFYKSELNREITESLLKNTQIQSIKKISIEQKGINVVVNITVELKSKKTLQSEVKIL